MYTFMNYVLLMFGMLYVSCICTKGLFVGKYFATFNICDNNKERPKMCVF